MFLNARINRNGFVPHLDHILHDLNENRSTHWKTLSSFSFFQLFPRHSYSGKKKVTATFLELYKIYLYVYIQTASLCRSFALNIQKCFPSWCWSMTVHNFSDSHYYSNSAHHCTVTVSCCVWLFHSPQIYFSPAFASVIFIIWNIEVSICRTIIQQHAHQFAMF